MRQLLSKEQAKRLGACALDVEDAKAVATNVVSRMQRVLDEDRIETVRVERRAMHAPADADAGSISANLHPRGPVVTTSVEVGVRSGEV